MESVCKRHASVGLAPAEQQLCGYRQLSSINYYRPPVAYAFSRSNRHAGNTAQFITPKESPLGILRRGNYHYDSRPLAGRSYSVTAPPGQARRKQSRVAWLLVAAQLLPRRDKPDGSNPAWLGCL
jgi:hypothetical protein